MQAGKPLQGDICTYRNNLNKIAMTLLSPKDAWQINAFSKEGVLCLDIEPSPQKDFPDSDRMTYYGYK